MITSYSIGDRVQLIDFPGIKFTIRQIFISKENGKIVVRYNNYNDSQIHNWFTEADIEPAYDE